MRGTAEEHELINDPAVRGQALKFLFAELPGITTIQFSFPVAVVAMYWDYVDNAQLLGWMASLFSLYAIRLLLARSYNRQIDQQALNIERWGGYFTFTSPHMPPTAQPRSGCCPRGHGSGRRVLVMDSNPEEE